MHGLKIAIGHEARTGKDTFADRIITLYGGYKLSPAEPLYDIATSIQQQLKKPVTKDPKLLQLLGEGMRNIYGDNVWVDTLVQRIKMRDSPEKPNILVVGMRYPNEMEVLKALGFITVKITRQDRVIDRDPSHISEIALKNANFDHCIENNGTIEEFFTKIDSVLEKIQIQSS
jgi:hypothetical protein